MAMNIGWSPESVNTIGERYVKQAAAALWYLDPHHERLSSRSVHLPQEFHSLHSFNDWQQKKVKQPLLTSAGLHDHILSHTMLKPYIAKSEYRRLREVTNKLVEAMQKNKEYLDTKNEQMKAVHKRVNVKVASDALEVRILYPCVDLPAAKYALLCELLSAKDDYDAISLNDIAPEDCYER